MSRTLVAVSPLSTGDIVGRSFRVFRQNLALIAKSLLVPTIITILGRVTLIVALSYGIKFVNNPAAGIAWIALGGVGGVVALIGVTYLWIKQLVLVRYLTGMDDTFAEAQKFVFSRIGLLVLLFFVVLIASLVDMAAWAYLIYVAFPWLQGKDLAPVFGSLFMATGIFGLIFSIVFISLVYNLVGIGITLEKSDFSDLLTEGLSLTAHSFWRSIGFLIIATTAITLVAYPLTLPVLIVVGTYLFIAGVATGAAADQAMPVGIQIFNSVWETGINMLIGPIYYLSYALYYRDLRMRQEGLDLVDRLKEIDRGDDSGKLSSHGI